MLTALIYPCQWRKENNIYFVRRNGYILLNFFQLNEEMRVEIESKRTFIVTAKNMDPLLDLDTRSHYDANDLRNEELLLYKKFDSQSMSILKTTKLEDRSFTFSYCEMPQE